MTGQVFFWFTFAPNGIAKAGSYGSFLSFISRGLIFADFADVLDPHKAQVPAEAKTSLTFTMKLPVDDRIPYIGIEIIKNGTKLETQVYRKSTNTGLLLHSYIFHTDKRYDKDSLLANPSLPFRTHFFFLSLPSGSLERANEECANCAPFSAVLITGGIL